MLSRLYRYLLKLVIDMLKIHNHPSVHDHCHQPSWVYCQKAGNRKSCLFAKEHHLRYSTENRKKEAANVNSGKGELQLLKAPFFCWSHLSFQGCHLYLVIRFFFQWGFPDLGNQPATTTHPAGSELQDLRSHFTKTVPGLAGRNTQRFWRWTVSKVERPEKKNPREAGGFGGIVLYAVLGGIFNKRYKDHY